MADNIDRSRKSPENKVPFVQNGVTYMVDYIDERPYGIAGIEYATGTEEERKKNRERIMEICYDIVQKRQFEDEDY